jgi:hypothetical protein
LVEVETPMEGAVGMKRRRRGTNMEGIGANEEILVRIDGGRGKVKRRRRRKEYSLASSPQVPQPQQWHNQ